MVIIDGSSDNTHGFSNDGGFSPEFYGNFLLRIAD